RSSDLNLASLNREGTTIMGFESRRSLVLVGLCGLLVGTSANAGPPPPNFVPNAHMTAVPDAQSFNVPFEFANNGQFYGELSVRDPGGRWAFEFKGLTNADPEIL